MQGKECVLDNDTNTDSISYSRRARYEAVGQLAAGIIHEINSPVQYIGDSMSFIETSFENLSKILIETHKCLRTHISDDELLEKCNNLLAMNDFEFIQDEYKNAFKRMYNGLEYIKSIVLALNRFNFCDLRVKEVVDIYELVNDMVVITKSEWKYYADVFIDMMSDDKTIKCYQGDIRQVILNLIINATHSIKEVYKKTKSKGTIEVKISQNNDFLLLSVRDTGEGIDDVIKNKIFDKYFTTNKEEGGTGQGLALVYDIVVNKHNGSIWFESEAGKGTTFHIKLPNM